jgi:plasmid stabilization system protein ParE
MVATSRLVRSVIVAGQATAAYHHNIVYVLEEDTVVVARILHGAQQWP